MSEAPVYPMSALVGLDELVTALVLCAVDPAIGGVLAAGRQGLGQDDRRPGPGRTAPARARRSSRCRSARPRTGSSARSTSPPSSPRARTGSSPVCCRPPTAGSSTSTRSTSSPTIWSTSSSTRRRRGINRVERDGVSHTHPSRFVLVGSMNPEEGELRPQLLDRFGLSVRVSAPSDPELRAEAVRRRFAFDDDPARFLAEWSDAEAELAARVREARPVPLADGLERDVAELCAAAGAEGLRGDLVICRAAAALGGWLGQATAGWDEVAVVAPLALGHRRRTPFGSSPSEPSDLDDLVSNPRRSDPERGGSDASGGGHDGAAPRDDGGPAPPPGTLDATAGSVDPTLLRSLADPGRRGDAERLGRGRAGTQGPQARGGPSAPTRWAERAARSRSHPPSSRARCATPARCTSRSTTCAPRGTSIVATTSSSSRSTPRDPWGSRRASTRRAPRCSPSWPTRTSAAIASPWWPIATAGPRCCCGRRPAPRSRCRASLRSRPAGAPRSPRGSTRLWRSHSRSAAGGRRRCSCS